jgi:SAM-dependent methyltransferase
LWKWPATTPADIGIRSVKATVHHEGKHLSASEVYSATDHCPVCLAREPRKPVFLIQRAPDIHLLRCPKCRGVSADQMPVPSVLDNYYTNYWPDEENRITFGSGARFAERILRYARINRQRDPIRILDFGGGDGTIAREIAQRLLAERKADVEIDLVDWGAQDAQLGEHVRVNGHRTLETVAGPYDLVIASAVLEHIPDVNPVMKTLFSLVGPGGFFYARTPYVLPFTRLHSKLDFTYPGHVHDMGSGFWGRITETFALRARIAHSGTSPVETLFSKHPARTMLACTFKIPAWIEQRLVSPSRKDRFWNLVAGWEIVLQFAE